MHASSPGGEGAVARLEPPPEKVRRGEESPGLAHTDWVHGNARNPSTKEGGEWKRRAVDGQSLNGFIFIFNSHTPILELSKVLRTP